MKNINKKYLFSQSCYGTDELIGKIKGAGKLELDVEVSCDYVVRAPFIGVEGKYKIDYYTYEIEKEE